MIATGCASISALWTVPSWARSPITTSVFSTMRPPVSRPLSARTMVMAIWGGGAGGVTAGKVRFAVASFE